MDPAKEEPFRSAMEIEGVMLGAAGYFASSCLLKSQSWPVDGGVLVLSKLPHGVSTENFAVTVHQI